MGDARKKVVVRLFAAEAGSSLASGYLPGAGLSADGLVVLMDPGGRVISFFLNDVKLIAYVRDFNLDDAVEPERMGRRAFAGRPRGPGLWVKLTFRGGDTLEGLMADDLSFVDNLLEERGVFLTPPDARSNTLRVFVPRSALVGFEVLGAVTTATRRKAIERATREPQPGLFGEM